MECTLPSTSKLRKNTTDQESIERSLKDLILSKTNEDDEDYNETILNRQRFSEFNKLLEILNMLNKQAKQVLEKEIYFERLLNRLLASRQAHSSIID